jgi:hypothetical protein
MSLSDRFLLKKGDPAGEGPESRLCEETQGASSEGDVSSEGGDAAEDGEETLDEEEEFKSKYQLTQEMGISEKIKMAITGTRNGGCFSSRTPISWCPRRS